MISFSIIIPVYNSAKYINHCFDSIINQNHDNLQIIFVNDGSTDNSLAILESFKAKNKNVVIFSQENAGPGVARNTGLKFADGDYIWFIDADDRIAPQSFIALSDILQKNMPEILCINSKRTENCLFEMATPDFSKNIVKISNKRAILNEPPAPWGKIYKRSFLKENKCNFPPYYFGEDLAEVYRLFVLAENICKTNAVIYYHLVTPDSLSSIFRPKYFNDFLNVLEALKNISDIYLQNRDELHYLAYMHAKTVLNFYIKHEYDNAQSSIEVIQKYIKQLDIENNIFYLFRKEIENKYEHSTSWKITEPLRTIKRFLKHIHKKKHK